MNEVIRNIHERRSVRSYRSEQIKEEEMDMILDAAIMAPSALNQQPWHFTVIQDKKVLEEIDSIVIQGMKNSAMEFERKMSENDSFKVAYGAPTLVLVWGREDSLAWRTDCAAAMQNMQLAASSLGIGSVWLGLVRHVYSNEKFMAGMKAPAGFVPYYGLALGYPAGDNGQPVPKRNRDVVTRIR